MFVILFKDETGLHIANFDNEVDYDNAKDFYGDDCRDLTQGEIDLFVDGLKYSGGASTTITGGTLLDAVISYSKIPLLYWRNKAKEKAKKYSNELISEGIKWRLNNSGAFDAVSLATSDRELLKEFRDGSDHGGFLYTGGKKIIINDSGMAELCDFVTKWVLKMGVKLVDEFEIIDSLDESAASSYDPSNSDWSVTWTTQQQSAGWSDNTLSQNP